MPAKKVKVDINDGEGNKFTVTFEGKVTRKKVMQLFDLVEILGGVPQETVVDDNSINHTKFDRVHQIIKKYFRVGWFSSKEVLSKYRSQYDEEIGLSTVSTYLSRLFKRGFLQRTGKRRKRYKLIRESTLSDSIQITD